MSNKPTQPTAREQRSLVRALERRFGQSVMPYTFKLVGSVPAYGDLWRIIDVETGSCVESTFYCGRLQVHREHDGTKASAKAA